MGLFHEKPTSLLLGFHAPRFFPPAHLHPHAVSHVQGQGNFYA